MGIRNITMDYLAIELGMSKRTLYEFFGQKDTLVIEALHEILRQENEELRRIIVDSDNVVEALFKIIRRKKELHTSLPRVFVEDAAKYMPKMRECLFNDKDSLRLNSLSFLMLERGVKEGVFRKELDIMIVDQFILDMIQLIHSHSRIAVNNLGSDELLNNILMPYLRGLSTPKGLALINNFFEEQKVSNE
ncbi:TetR/AcrR family transcriptional regulator [Bacteroidales bacterium]